VWPVWRATIPRVQGPPEPEDGPERPQAFLVMSALKAACRSYGGQPTEAPFLKLANPHSYFTRPCIQTNNTQAQKTIRKEK